MKGERVNESQTNLSSAMPKRERESILRKKQNRKGEGGSLSDCPVFERQKKSSSTEIQLPLLYNSRHLRHCAPMRSWQTKRTQHTHQRLSRFRIKMLIHQLLRSKTRHSPTHAAHILNRVAVGQLRLGHKAAQRILKTRPEWAIHLGQGSHLRP